MSELRTERCVPCEGGVAPLTVEEAEALMRELNPGWSLHDSARLIARDFQFGNFHETMAFVNALAWIAHREDHHPDLEIGYRHCLVRYSTHAIGGLSQNDFICAAKIDELVS